MLGKLDEHTPPIRSDFDTLSVPVRSRTPASISYFLDKRTLFLRFYHPKNPEDRARFHNQIFFPRNPEVPVGLLSQIFFLNARKGGPQHQRSLHQLRFCSSLQQTDHRIHPTPRREGGPGILQQLVMAKQTMVTSERRYLRSANSTMRRKGRELSKGRMLRLTGLSRPGSRSKIPSLTSLTVTHYL